MMQVLGLFVRTVVEGLRHCTRWLPIVGLVLVLPGAAMAAGGLVISPQLVELDSRQRSKVLTLANRGEETQTYRISVINYRMDPDGSLYPADTPSAGEGFATGLFRYAPRQITLEPGRPQTVRILYRRPANLGEGEYRSHLLFQQVPKARPATASRNNAAGLSIAIEPIFGITVPVIVRHGKLEATGELTDLNTTSVNGGTGISLRIARSGSKSLRGDLVASVDGENLGRLNNVAVYLSTPYREIVLPLSPEVAKAAAGREVVVEYRPRGDNAGPPIASGSVVLQ
ncbi:fimbrial biogenesis chaperone [Denitrobaculum tricleocarpae]|uniref:Molecular chaperone n=1 Tax=Denitrobaculum tricleocarpae TaxID=2591009 RepID=A0A545TB16_9PROT|nr:molecular chaperone [Denitrobaculum tricleocarpae]TQV74410.1 molecular chaperone [Denitrobaculum tricleocarpae]